MDASAKIELLCTTILKTDAESWEIRNKAMLQLTEIVVAHKDDAPEALNEIFSANVFKLLKEPVKNMVLDLRSQQVRDTCQFLMRLAEVTGERMKPFLRDSFATILEGAKIPHKVTSGYIDECIIHLIKHVTFKGAIVLIMHEIKESKSKAMREHCLEYINLILVHWDVSEKELEFFVEAIKIGLEDAAVRAREISRAAYLNMFNMYPEKAEKIKAMLPKAYQAKLARTEEEGLQTLPSSPGSSTNLSSSIGSTGLKGLANHLNSTGDSLDLSLDMGATPSHTNTNTNSHASSLKSTSTLASNSATAKHTAAAPTAATATVKKAHVPAAPVRTSTITSTAASHDVRNAEVIPVPAKKKPTVGYPKVQPSSSETLSSKYDKLQSGATVNLLASSASSDVMDGSRSSGENLRLESSSASNRGSLDSMQNAPTTQPDAVEQAVLSLQARVRGTLSRRRSVVHNPFAALAASSPEPHAPQALSGHLHSALNSSGSLASAASSGHTSHATHSSAGADVPASGAVSFASSTRDRPATTGSVAANALRTPASKKTGVRNAHDSSLPAFSTTTTSTVKAASAAAAAAPASVRKTSTGSAESSTARSTSAARSPRAASTSSAAVGSARSRSASKTRTGAVSSSVSSPDRTTNVLQNARLEPAAQSAVRRGTSPLTLNSRVYVNNTKDGKLPGTVKFVGPTTFAAGVWVGVALDSASGKNDGTVAGRRYFECAPEHGLFVKEDVVERILPGAGDTVVDEEVAFDAVGDASSTSAASSVPESIERKGTITGLLKLKLSQMMELLNHQLEIVVELEDEDRRRAAAGGGAVSARAAELHAEIVSFTSREQALISAFKQQLQERLP